MWRSRQPDPHEAAKHAEQGAVPVSNVRPARSAGKRSASKGKILQSQLVVQQPSSSPLWLDVCFVST